MQRNGNQPPESMWAILQHLRQQWPGGGWSWDSRFSCVASTFSVEILEQAKSAALNALPHVFDEHSLLRAPSIIRQLAKNTGGVRADQMLLARQCEEGLIAYGLWWPWRNEITISFRLGLVGNASSRHEMQLMDLFGAYM